MKKYLFVPLTILILTLSINISTTISFAQSSELWNKVEDAQNKGLPKTAIEYLDQMIPDYVQSKQYALAVKAMIKKITLESVIQGNKPEEKIFMISKEIKGAPTDIKPLLKLIQARWYWQYYLRNRWRFQNRNATASIDDADFTTWDLPRLFDEVDAIYTDILADAALLKEVPITLFAEFLDKGSVDESISPTLYDFAVREAIGFYTDGDQYVKQPEDAFEIAADSNAFKPADIFLNYIPETTDTQSPKLKALKLYQDILRFHELRGDTQAFADADLQRLNFIHQFAFGEDKDAVYFERLQEFMADYASYEVSSMAAYYWADQLRIKGELVKAHAVALKGKQMHPGSIGSDNCAREIEDIEAKQFEVQGEYAVTPNIGEIQINYKNIEKLHFRVVPDKWADFDSMAQIWKMKEVRYPDYDDINRIMSKQAVKTWSVDLEKTEDFKNKSKMIELPKLKPGFYRLIASWDKGFGKKNNSIRVTSFWVTRIALVYRSDDGRSDGFVLDADTGEPLPGARVSLLEWQSRNRDDGIYYKEAKTVYTDENGYFNFNYNKNKNGMFYVTYQGEQFSSLDDIYFNKSYPQPKVFRQTVFFTDRSIYRPGQMVHFKVLAIEREPDADSYEFIKGQNLDIEFRDPNNQEIEKVTLVTNDFGSASGTFNAPLGNLTGLMSIRCSNLTGQTQIRVEEYKRPKFKVDFEKYAGLAKLGDTVSVKGNAVAYTGAALDNVKVRYRVVRQVRYPFWCRFFWWGGNSSQDTREITHGTAETDENGDFVIDFAAIPDKSISKDKTPTFIYTVYADVTDTTGETRSASINVPLGYTSLQLELKADEWIEADKTFTLTINSTNLSGEPLESNGAVAIYSLKQPDKPIRKKLFYNYFYDQSENEKSNPSDWMTWEEDRLIKEDSFQTKDSKSEIQFALPQGVYKVVATSLDEGGEEVKSFLPFMVVDSNADRFQVKIPQMFKAESLELEPGQALKALWGTGYQQGRAFIEIEHKGDIVQSYWTQPGATQQVIGWDVQEQDRGGFFVHVTQVKENRAYLTTTQVNVPWTNKKLDLSFETFRSKLMPGQEETWKIKVKGPDAEAAVAEMVATLYDASLDAFYPLTWPNLLSMFWSDYTTLYAQFGNVPYPAYNYVSDLYHPKINYRSRSYLSFPHEIVEDTRGYGMPLTKGLRANRFEAKIATKLPMQAQLSVLGDVAESHESDGFAGEFEDAEFEAFPMITEIKKPDLSKVSPRKNLNETAFFFPDLTTDPEGIVSLTFTMPEALTEWNFLGFAHSAGLLSGLIKEKAVTQKDLMVQPNPPRFLREGDELEFTAKITNMSDTEQSGIVNLTLSNARTLKNVDSLFGNFDTEQSFTIEPKRSKSVSWTIKVPDFTDLLLYKVVAATDTLSDGEEDYLPVLSKRIFVTESMPLPIRGPDDKTFTFKKLLDSAQSKTLESKALTLQMASNPAWYAVQALPYLMEYPYQCSEQIFNRLYANSIATHIANSDPRIRRIFDQWEKVDIGALQSNLEKNQDLKSVMLEETPWVQAAQNESESKKHIGLLFDQNHMRDALQRADYQLSKQQLSNGAWPWFPGGKDSFYITLYIMTGYGRLKAMDIHVDMQPALKSLRYLDKEIEHIYKEIVRKGDLDKNNLTSTIAMYLYGRSFFLQDQPITPSSRAAVDYFLSQAREYWLSLDSRLSQGHLALALSRFGDESTPTDIVNSLRERSVSDEEMGMFWRELELSWWWFRAPIETQAVMIEVFDEIAHDRKAVEDMKVWLLKQKQTQDWKTTKATADAVYALLRRGTDLLLSENLVEVTLGGVKIKPEAVEAGTGFYEKKFVEDEIKPEYGDIKVRKVDDGVAWGSLHWQYMEDMDKVTPHKTPLHLEKALYVKRDTKSGPQYELIDGPVEVGDKVSVRITLRVDRDMEYVHLKDYRGSGTEPVNVLSGYKYQDGLAYYEATKDTATHFFIEYLPKGTYVFEYPVMVQHKGRYQMGIAQIQCLYAPEFNSHSESEFLVVE